MFTAYAIVAIILSLALVGSGIAKLRKEPRVVKGISEDVGVPLAWFPPLALAEFAGAVGLALGLWMPALGIAAAIGVVLYFAGAVAAHVRVHDRNLIPPLTLALLAVAALVLRVLSA